MRIRSDATRTVSEDRSSDEGIAAALVRGGHLKKADVEAALDNAAASGSTFAEAAIELGLLSWEQIHLAIGRQRGGPLMSAGDERIDPLLVAAFEGDGAYMGKVRAIRSRLISPAADGKQSINRTCAIVAVNCEREAAVLAANIAIVLVRGQTPVLLIDAIDTQARIADLFRIPSDNAGDQTIRETAVPQLWISSGHRDGLVSGGGVAEGEPVLRRTAGWKESGGQVIAVVSVNGRNSAGGVTAALRGLEAVLLVAKKNTTLVSEMQALITGLDNAEIPVTGVVLV